MFLIQKLKDLYLKAKKIEYILYSIHSQITESLYRERLDNHKNNFAVQHAAQYFSQSDEDGITLEILARISKLKPLNKYFLEFGVGNGCENNSLILLANGYKGSWIGGQHLAFSTSGILNLEFHNCWITLDNIVTIYQQARSQWRINQFDVVSLDLDGNDFHLISKLLENDCNPDLFICEYNAIFPPNIFWSMPYDENHIWRRDQYFGASFIQLVTLFQRYNYFPCACNPQTGANIFFVKNEYRLLFPDVPDNVSNIYSSAFYRTENKFTHKVSADFIHKMLTSFG